MFKVEVEHTKDDVRYKMEGRLIEYFESHGLPGPAERLVELDNEKIYMNGEEISYNDLVEILGVAKADEVVTTLTDLCFDCERLEEDV